MRSCQWLEVRSIIRADLSEKHRFKCNKMGYIFVMTSWGTNGQSRPRGATYLGAVERAAKTTKPNRRSPSPYRDFDRHPKNKSSIYRWHRWVNTLDVIMVVKSWVRKHTGYLALSFPLYCFLGVPFSESQPARLRVRAFGHPARHDYQKHPQHWGS